MAYHWQDREISSEQLAALEKEDQMAVMKEWFLARYENPGTYCSYDGQDHYDFRFGGPYVAYDKLSSEFSEIVLDQTIKELVNNLEVKCSEWAARPPEGYDDWPHQDDYYQDDYYEIDAALDNQTPLISLKQNLEKLKKLLIYKDGFEEELQKFQHMMIYGFCITSLESYLSDMFTKQVFKNQAHKQKYLETESTLKNKKFSYPQIMDIYKKLDLDLKKEIADTTFHNLSRVKGLFQGVLGIDIGDISDLNRFINKRHDFVHRGGKDKEGNEVDTTVPEINDLIVKVESFCSAIDEKINRPDAVVESIK